VDYDALVMKSQAWRRLTERSEILPILEKDRLYAGYAIGDLEPGLFEHCDWFGAEERSPRGKQAQALALCYHDFRPPVLFVMGDPAGVEAIVREAPLPARVYLNCRGEHLAAAGVSYTWVEMTPMWRMALRVETFKPVAADCAVLGASDAEEVSRLFALGGGEAFRPGQMEGGIYRGIRQAGRLVAVAGTHLVSHTFGIAAIGNVFTDPEWRGHGFGTAATAAVAGQLLTSGLRDIILNVSQANTAAIRVYEHLGFARYCGFSEGPARKSQGR
jgi:ribosomal protein S18 acetylase RimI-like enzyme